MGGRVHSGGASRLALRHTLAAWQGSHMGSAWSHRAPARVPLNSGIEDLREKREEVNRSIAKDEEEKGERPS